MFLQQLDEANQARGRKPKQTKKKYSAGFKNHHPQKMNNQSGENEQEEEEEDIFDQLRIGNLKELYFQSVHAEDTRKLELEKQQSSMARLILKNKAEVHEDDEANEEEQMAKRLQQEQTFNKAYHKVEDYKSKASKVLFHGEFHRLKQKLFQIVRKHGNQQEYSSTFSAFLIQKYEVYSSKVQISNQELLLDFSNYLNQLSTGFERKTKEMVKVRVVEDVVRKNVFLYGFFDFGECLETVVDAEGLEKYIRKEGKDEIQLQWSIVEQLLCKKITIPYETELYRASKRTSELPTPQKQNQQQKDMQPPYKFIASRIPKSTYTQPKEGPKSQLSKTTAKPFNLTVTSPAIEDLNEVYQWDRTFQAGEIPKTTYKAITIKSLDQSEKKKRMLELLHSSNYPSNMKNLENYVQGVQQKHSQLEKKYEKVRVAERRKRVPNFQMFHARQIQDFEEAKIEKKQLTKPQSFKLSQPRPPKEQAGYHENNIEMADRKVRRDHSRPQMQPQSTKNFDTYVNHLKGQKEEKLEREQAQKKELAKKGVQDQQYKQLLKDRVDCELGKIPKPAVRPQPQNQNTLKVNLQRIYSDQPLLMERQAAKSRKHGQVAQKDWKPII